MECKHDLWVPFKIFGLQRTATNLTAQLLKQNFLVETLGKGTEWKHGPVAEPHRRWRGVPVRFVVSTKHPHAWLVSCYRFFGRAYLYDPTMPPQFRKNPSIKFHEFLAMPCYDFANPMDWWNRRYRQWKQCLPSRKTAIVRQEQLLQDQLALLKNLEEHFKLSRRTPRLHPITERVDVIPDSSGPMNREYYLNRDYMEMYSPRLLRRVNRELDSNLMAELGYSVGSRQRSMPKAPARAKKRPGLGNRLTKRSARGAAIRFGETIGPYPANRFAGQGIVICAGGPRYFPCAWVCINMLRHVGVTLPIEMWGLNAQEIDARTRRWVAPLGVRCVNAEVVRKRYPARILRGMELKAYSILHSRFEEVLFLDADNMPVADPTSLFNSRPYKKHGAIFWPCYGSVPRDQPIWKICGVPYRREPDFESGQMIINKKRCWRALNLAMHMNENSDFYYRYTLGDRETFHMAWRMLGQDYAMVPTPIKSLDSTACQHDFRGRRLFQHRHIAKWNLDQPNEIIPGFRLQEVCLHHLQDLYKRCRRIGHFFGVPLSGGE